MATDLNKRQLDILANTTNMDKDTIITSYLEFKKLINKEGLIDLKSFTDFYCKLLPKKGNAEKFCKFIFQGKNIFERFDNGKSINKNINCISFVQFVSYFYCVKILNG